jgi:hypothetical protein
MFGQFRRPAGMATILLAMVGLGIFMTAHCAEGYPFGCDLTLPGTDASPLADISFQKSESGEELRYTLKVRNLADITMAHLHIGFKEGIGALVVWLYPPAPPPVLIPGPLDGVLAEGTITAGDLVGPLRGQPLSTLIKEMEDGNTYVNVHTLAHPQGSICGQVVLSRQ